jgi:hypothetical protein
LLPLLFAGAVNGTLAVKTESVAVPIVGALGTDGVLKYGPVFAVLVPTALVAVRVAV